MYWSPKKVLSLKRFLHRDYCNGFFPMQSLLLSFDMEGTYRGVFATLSDICGRPLVDGMMVLNTQKEFSS